MAELFKSVMLLAVIVVGVIGPVYVAISLFPQMLE